MQTIQKVFSSVIVCFFMILSPLQAHDFMNEVLYPFRPPSFREAVSDEQGDFITVSEEYGNKTANLSILYAISSTIATKVLRDSRRDLQIPLFFAIGSSAITVYLGEKYRELWSDFVKKQKVHMASGEKTVLGIEAIERLRSIRRYIQASFAEGTRKPVSSIHKEIEEYLGLSEFANKLLMVRSTGSEDSKELANAGGNESISSVDAKLLDVWNAMGQVVISYFSEKSLSQRFISGDDITKDPLIPVLVQVMIGEHNDIIPVSGVIFSQEAEGNTPGVTHVQAAYGHNEGVVNSLVAVDTFYVGKSGVINAVIRNKKERILFGSEGRRFIVNEDSRRAALSPDAVIDLKHIADKIQETYDYPIDIEFVMLEDVIYLVQARPIVQKKAKQDPDYLSDEYLEKKENLVLRGESIGVAGGFVRSVMSADEVIIQDELPQALTSYNKSSQRDKVKIIVVKEMAPATSHEATTFRGYGIPVLVLSQDICSELEQWLELENPTIFFDTQRALAVRSTTEEFVEKNDHRNSGWFTHPIPMMTSIVKDVYGKNIDFALTYKEFFAWKKGDKDDLKDEMSDLIAKVKKERKKKNVVAALKRIVYRVCKLLQQEEGGSVVLSKTFFEKFLRGAKKLEMGPGALERTKLLCVGVLVAAAEIVKTIDLLDGLKLKKDEARLFWLYPIKFLEALMYQQLGTEVMGGSSYVLALKRFKEDFEASEKIKARFNTEQRSYIVQLMKGDKVGLQEELRESWQDFLNGIGRIALRDIGIKEWSKKNFDLLKLQKLKLLKTLSDSVSKLTKMGVFELWFNTSFKNVWDGHDGEKPSKRSFDVAKALVEELANPVDKNVFVWVENSQRVLDAWERKLDEWERRDDFEKVFKAFTEQFIKRFVFGDQERKYNVLMYEPKKSGIAGLDYSALQTFAEKHGPLTTRFERAGRLGKLVVLSFLQKVVDVYDRSIKGLTGSTEYGNEKDAQIQRFAQLLAPYLNLMEQWTIMVENEEGLMYISLKASEDSWSFKRYLKRIRVYFRGNYTDPSHWLLHATEKFSVGAAQIGSKSDYSLSLENLIDGKMSFEDLFTLAHQNLIMIISVLNKKYGVSVEHFPPFIKRITSELENIVPDVSSWEKDEGAFEEEHWKAKPSLVGVSYTYPRLTLRYNIPLRQHSSAIEVSYNVSPAKAKKAYLTLTVMGVNERNRLFGVGALASIASSVLSLQDEALEFSKPPRMGAKDHQVKCTLKLVDRGKDDTENIELARKLISLFVSMGILFPSNNPVAALVELDKVVSLGKGLHENMSLTEFMEKSGRLRSLPKSVFSFYIFNRDLMKEYLERGEFVKALEIMKVSLLTIAKEKRFSVYTRFGAYGNPADPLQRVVFDALKEFFEAPPVSEQVRKFIYELVDNKLLREPFFFEATQFLVTLYESDKTVRETVVQKILQLFGESDLIINNLGSVRTLLLSLAEKAFSKDQLFGIFTTLYKSIDIAQKTLPKTMKGRFDVIRGSSRSLFEFSDSRIKELFEANKKVIIAWCKVDIQDEVHDLYRDVVLEAMGEEKFDIVVEIAKDLINRKAYYHVFDIAENLLNFVETGDDHLHVAKIGIMLAKAEGMYQEHSLLDMNIKPEDITNPEKQWKKQFVLEEKPNFQIEKARELVDLFREKARELALRSGGKALSKRLEGLAKLVKSAITRRLKSIEK